MQWRIENAGFALQRGVLCISPVEVLLRAIWRHKTPVSRMWGRLGRKNQRRQGLFCEPYTSNEEALKRADPLDEGKHALDTYSSVVVNSMNVRRFLSRNVGIRRETEESTRKTPGETAPHLASFITLLYMVSIPTVCWRTSNTSHRASSFS